MSKVIDIENSKNIDKTIRVRCKNCNSDTNHKILAGVQLNGKDYHSPEDYFGWKEEYEVAQCLGCENVVFHKTHEDEDSYYYDPELGCPVYNKSVNLYPKPEDRSHGIKDRHLLPPKLQRIYLETISSLNSGHTILAGIGIRAIVETVCKDQGTSSRDLFGRINELKDNGVLTDWGAQILHKLRALGNNAAHEVEPQSGEQLKLAFDVIDNLLHSVYILPEKAKQTFPSV
ncbi:DUF4145 domain-containing protein [Vibrio vulnificus]|nr:DUF4145 domain-containing protein [Vibrio vulnificus]MCU8492553.1 DUF4145 domain-containing protein [Vibrio vulnificus]MCU8510377.1 DUF4145 domain-containing protein [Vibrio vulnificus]